MLLALATIALYFAYTAFRLGLHQRLSLALGPVSIVRLPARAARLHGDRILFTTDEPCAWELPAPEGQAAPDPRAWSAARVEATVGSVAAMLVRIALRPGERVAVLKRNHLDMHVFAAAIVRAGGIACPINDQFDAGGTDAYLRHLDARILITDPDTLRRLLSQHAGLGPVASILLADRRSDEGAATCAEVRAAHPGVALTWIEEALRGVRPLATPVERAPAAVRWLVHSSGTTGFPKAVMLTDEAQSHAVRGWLAYVHLSRMFDRGYLAVPNNHQAVMLTFHGALLLGLRCHWTAAYGGRGFDAERVVHELEAGRYTGYFGFPITYTQMKEVALAPNRLRGMRFWATTADASHQPIVRRFTAVGGAFRSFGIPLRGSVFLDAQGSSEVGTPSVLRYYTRFTRAWERRIGRPGSTPFGPDVRIATRDGSEQKRGEVGRLEVRGPTVFAGYWRNPELTARSIRDGWFFTGDVARIAADGHVVQLDREVDVIETRDGPVYSLPIEEIVHEHRAVFDACVYGARQADGSQRPAVAIALRPGSTCEAERLRAHLNAMLAPEQALDHIEILPWSEFPIGVTGKTLKRAFRDRSETRLRARGGADSSASRGGITRVAAPA